MPQHGHGLTTEEGDERTLKNQQGVSCQTTAKQGERSQMSAHGPETQCISVGS